MKKLLLAAVGGIVLSASLAAGAQVAIRIGPPPRPVERIPPPPPEHRDWAWHAGYHRWDGNAYVWVPGTYVEPACPQLDSVPAARLIGALSDLIVPHGAVLLAGPERCGEVRELLASCGLHDSDDLRAGTHLLARKKDVCCHDRDQQFHDRSAIWCEG